MYLSRCVCVCVCVCVGVCVCVCEIDLFNLVAITIDQADPRQVCVCVCVCVTSCLPWPQFVPLHPAAQTHPSATQTDRQTSPTGHKHSELRALHFTTAHFRLCSDLARSEKDKQQRCFSLFKSDTNINIQLIAIAV